MKFIVKILKKIIKNDIEFYNKCKNISYYYYNKNNRTNLVSEKYFQNKYFPNTNKNKNIEIK